MKIRAQFRTRLLVGLAILAAACGVLMGGVSPVSAHAIVISTDPQDGSQLSTAPSSAKICFSAPVVLKLSTFTLVDGNGNGLPVNATETPGSNGSCLDLAFPPLAPNVYRLNWKATSADDLHFTPGSIVFGYQTAVSGAQVQPEASAPQLGEVLIRWLNFGALAVLLGGLSLFFILFYLNPVTSEESGRLKAARKSMLRLSLAAGGLALVGRAGLVLYQFLNLDGSSSQGASLGDIWQSITGSSYGGYAAMAGICILISLSAIIVISRLASQVEPTETGASTKGGPSAWIGWIGCGAALMGCVLAWLEALTSHANSFNDLSVVRIGLDALHLLAAMLWVGGLVGVAWVIAPWLHSRDGDPAGQALAKRVLLRFSPLAAGATAVLVVTGLYNSGQQVASLDALLTTLYGQGLLIKVFLVGLTLLLALYHTTRLHAGLRALLVEKLHLPAKWFGEAGHRMGRTLVLEALGGAAILLLVALLSAAQPGRGPQFDPPQVVNNAITTGQVGDLLVTFAMKPGRPGPNFVEIGAFETRKPSIAPVESVTMRLNANGSQDVAEYQAIPLGGGRFQVNGVSLAQPGSWQVSLEIGRKGGASAEYITRWDVLTSQAPRPVLVSNQPLEPILNAVALGLGALIAAILLAFWFVRRKVHTRLPVDTPAVE